MKTKTLDARSVLTAAVAGAAMGACVMYLLDPDQGRRRVALGRDRALHAARQARDFVDVGMRDLQQRIQGLIARARRSMKRGPVDDETLWHRVRSALGRAVSNPHAIDVQVMDGCVCLGGVVLADECARLLDEVHKVAGVRQIDNQLDARPSVERVPALQGLHGSKHGGRAASRQHNWAPGPRLLAVAGGTGLALYGIYGATAQRRSWAGLLIGTAGIALAARAVRNEPLLDAARQTARRLPLKPARGLERQTPAAETTAQVPPQTVSILTVDPAIVLQ